jgi:hypothetical protein
MKYLKVFTDFADAMEELGDAERGRLFTAMLKYAETGAAPDFRGNERFIWPVAKLQIDRTVEEYSRTVEARRECGKLGGRPKKANGFDENQKKQKVFSETKKSKDKDNDKDKENIPSGNNTPPTPPRGRVDVPEALMENWNGFCEMRKKIKKPLTDRAAKMILNELERLAPGDNHTKGLILDQSVKRCWQDVYPLKGDKSAGGTDNVFLQMLQEEGQHEPY